MNQQTKWLGVVAALAVISTGCVDRGAQSQAKRTEAIVTDPVRVVRVATPQPQRLEDSLEITGQIQTALDVQVSAKVAGRLVEVMVADGATVAAGQVIARQETTQLAAQLSQANASLQSAQAAYLSAQSQLATAVRNAAVNPSKSRSGVRQAEAQLRSAKAQLQKALNGARPEERRQLDANLTSARQNLDTQKKELDRVRVLVNQGAAPGNRLDQQLAAYQNAEAQFRNAQEAVNLVRLGTRQEDLETARESVRQAEEGLRVAKANLELDPGYRDQVNVARAQVESARAQIDNAKAQIIVATQSLEDATIRAPFGGRISGVPAQVGSMLSPGVPVVRIVGTSGTYFEGEVPESRVSVIRPGQPVSVEIESQALTLAGTVSAVSPRGSSVSRQFVVRISFGAGPGNLNPGTFAKGRITVGSTLASTVLPQTAVVDRQGRTVVYVVENDAVREVKVQTGLRGDSVVEVKGLEQGAKVVIVGQQGLEDGTKVRIEEAKAATAIPMKAGS